MKRSYEQVIVFDPTLPDAAVKEEIKRWKDYITEREGEDISVDEWGKKELAFSLKKHKAGAFVVIKYSTSRHSLPNDLTSVLRINEKVIKFQSHRTNLPQRKFQGNPKRVGSPTDSSDDGLGLDVR